MADFAANLKSAENGHYYTTDQLLDFVADALGGSRPVVNRHDKPSLYNIPASFDTEFSSFEVEDGDGIHPCGTVYLWGFGLNGCVTVGRSTAEFADWLPGLATVLNCGETLHLRVYVHNLGADFQYIRHWFEWRDLFARESLQPLSATTSIGIEFRDSLALTGCNLASWGASLLRYPVKKLVGDLDYTKMRHSKTPIIPEEMQYMINDCLVVMAGIMERIEQERGRIDHIPMTKTGYVRRVCRKNCLRPNFPELPREERKAARAKAHHEYRYLMDKLTLTAEEYTLARQAFAGGFTHANAAYVLGQPQPDVDSYDLQSAYPAAMVNGQYPMGRGVKVDMAGKSLSDILAMMHRYCCIFRVRFEGLRPKIPQDNYISISKSTKISGYRLNNGRVVSADVLEMAMTNVDFDVVQSCYEWDRIGFANFWRYARGYLPRRLIETILYYYSRKCELKGVPGREEEYQQAKEMVNSIYGDLVKALPTQTITYVDGRWTVEERPLEECIEEYNNDRYRYNSYLWGVFVTAYVRRTIFSGILEAGMDYLYSDTDSLKMIHGERHADWVLRYNERVERSMERAAAAVGFDIALTRPITKSGVQKSLGILDYEGRMERFQALGAKRYMHQHGDVVSITVSGVNKGTAIPYLCRMIGAEFTEDAKTKGLYHLADPSRAPELFDLFKDGLTFPGEYYLDPDQTGAALNASGKLLHQYYNEPCRGKLRDYLGNVAEYEERSILFLWPTSYTLGLNGEFVQFCRGIIEYNRIK